MSLFDQATVAHLFVMRYRADTPPPVYACAHCDAPRGDRVGMCLNCGSRMVAAALSPRRAPASP